MSTKKPFWQELVLQAIAPGLALLGVMVTVRPDIIPATNECKRLVTASLDHTGDDRLPSVAPSMAPGKEELPDIQATSSDELPGILYNYDFSLPHFAILIATLILLVQVIRLIHNWKK